MHANGTPQLTCFVHPNGAEDGAIHSPRPPLFGLRLGGLVSASHRQWQLRDTQILP